MEKTIHLCDFLKEKNILHSEVINIYTDGIKCLFENRLKFDGITYKYTNHFVLFGIDVLKVDNYGHYYYEFIPERVGDIIDNITYESPSNLNVKLTYYIGDVDYQPEEFNEFIFISAHYFEFKIRVTFLEKPKLSDEFKLHSRYWLLDTNHRRNLINTYKVITKHNVYMYGCCGRLNNFTEDCGNLNDIQAFIK
jgi:hypothetical protein